MPNPLVGSPTSAVALSGQINIDALIGGGKWGGPRGVGLSLSYSFPGETSFWSTSDINGYNSPVTQREPFVGSAPLSVGEQNAARQALQAWSAVANIQFVEVPDTQNDVGDIRFTVTIGAVQASESAHAYIPFGAGSSPVLGDVWLNSSARAQLDQGLGKGGPGFFVFLHEIGHAIGLKHPGDQYPHNAVTLSGSQDFPKFAIMSSFILPGTPPSDVATSIFPTTPMLFDILAIQYLYGPNLSHAAGNDVYTFVQGQDYYETIWDAGGADTIRYDASSVGGRISLEPGTYSQLGNPIQFSNGASQADTVAIAFGAIIENAEGGSGNDTITGNQVGNVLNGNAGRDSLDGLGADDTINGGAGNDTLIGGAGNDQLVGGAGIDLAAFGAALNQVSISRLSDGSFRLTSFEGIDTFREIELVQLGGAGPVSVDALPVSMTLQGDDGNNGLIGGQASDSISGAGGRDSIFGLQGDDTLDGGAGDDFLYGDIPGSGNDNISGGDGADTAFAGDGNDTMTGGSGRDFFIADGGNDSLTLGDDDDVGFGSAGADTIIGGSGNDFLFGDGGSDSLVGNAGNDRLHVDASDVVAIGSDGAFDVLVVVSNAGGLTRIDLGSVADQNSTGSGPILSGFEAVDASIASAAVSVTGAAFNGFGNVLFGSPQNDTINGSPLADIILGNPGADILTGGFGNDTIIADAGNDTLTGGTGADQFFYAGGSLAGAVRVTDFSPADDTVLLASSLGFTAQQARSQTIQIGADAVLNFGGGDSITLQGVSVAGLTAADFVIV